MILLIIYR